MFPELPLEGYLCLGPQITRQCCAISLGPWIDRLLSWSLLMIHLCFLHLELRRRYPSMAMSEYTEFALWACQNSCRSWQTQKFVLQGPRRMHRCKQRKSENPSEESNSWVAACHWPSLSPRGKAAHGHIVNGATKDKVSIMTLPQVKPHLLIHDDMDDASQFETHIKRQSTSNAVKKAFNSIKCYAVDEFHRANRTCSRRNSPDERSRSYAMFRPTCLRPSTPGSARKILNSMTLWIASVIDSGCRSPSSFGIAAWRPCPSKSPGDQRLQHVSAKQANRHRDVRLPDLAAGIGQKLVDRPGVGYKMHGGFREENGNLTTKTKKRKKKQKHTHRKHSRHKARMSHTFPQKIVFFVVCFLGFGTAHSVVNLANACMDRRVLECTPAKNRTPQKQGHSQLSFQQIKCLHDKNWLQVICQERHNKGLLPLRSRCQILIKGRYLE